jgi:hypothetical protein
LIEAEQSTDTLPAVFYEILQEAERLWCTYQGNAHLMLSILTSLDKSSDAIRKQKEKATPTQPPQNGWKDPAWWVNPIGTYWHDGKRTLVKKIPKETKPTWTFAFFQAGSEDAAARVFFNDKNGFMECFTCKSEECWHVQALRETGLHRDHLAI